MKLYISVIINTSDAIPIRYIKWLNGILLVFRKLDNKLFSITIICSNIEIITPPTINLLFLSGIENADADSLRQLKT